MVTVEGGVGMKYQAASHAAAITPSNAASPPNTARRFNPDSALSSSTPGMLLIVPAQPIHAVVVLRVAHDGVDVIELLDGELDDQSRPMDPIIKGATHVVGRTAPRE